MQIKEGHRHSINILILLSVCLIAYAPLLWNDFIVYDDRSYVTGNAKVREGLTLQGILWAFGSFHSYNWHPLTWISHMLDVQLFGLNPAGHHFTSIVFHALNSILIYLLTRVLLGGQWKSLCVALLFAVHPAHVESVAWVAERKDMLSTFFGMLAALAYVKYARTPKMGQYAVVLGFFLLSLLSKPMLVSLPLVLLLLDYWPLERWQLPRSTRADGKMCRNIVMEKMPLFALALASCVVTFLVQSREGAVNVQTPFLLNCGNAIISYVKYLFLLVWPHPLAVIYPFQPDDITLFNVSGAAIVIVLISGVVAYQRKIRPYLMLGWLWYLVTLLPVIGFVRIGDHSIADRYTYVPYLGLFIIVVWGAEELGRALRVGTRVITVAAVIIFALMSMATIRQQLLWRNSITLFEHAIRVTDDNAVAHKMLGIAYGEQGNREKAAAEGAMARMLHYRYMVKVHPRDYDLHFRLGNAYHELGRLEESQAAYQAALALNPRLSKAYNNMGIVQAMRGNLGEARRSFLKAIETSSDNAEARENLRMIENRITGR